MGQLSGPPCLATLMDAAHSPWMAVRCSASGCLEPRTAMETGEGHTRRCWRCSCSCGTVAVVSRSFGWSSPTAAASRLFSDRDWICPSWKSGYYLNTAAAAHASAITPVTVVHAGRPLMEAGGDGGRGTLARANCSCMDAGHGGGRRERPSTRSTRRPSAGYERHRAATTIGSVVAWSRATGGPGPCNAGEERRTRRSLWGS